MIMHIHHVQYGWIMSVFLHRHYKNNVNWLYNQHFKCIVKDNKYKIEKKIIRNLNNYVLKFKCSISRFNICLHSVIFVFESIRKAKNMMSIYANQVILFAWIVNQYILSCVLTWNIHYQISGQLHIGEC